MAAGAEAQGGRGVRAGDRGQCAQVLKLAERSLEHRGGGDARGAAAELRGLEGARGEGGEDAGVEGEEAVAEGDGALGEEALLHGAGAGRPPGAGGGGAGGGGGRRGAVEPLVALLEERCGRRECERKREQTGDQRRPQGTG